jgi:hypothetical protein
VGETRRQIAVDSGAGAVLVLVGACWRWCWHGPWTQARGPAASVGTPSSVKVMGHGSTRQHKPGAPAVDGCTRALLLFFGVTADGRAGPASAVMHSLLGIYYRGGRNVHYMHVTTCDGMQPRLYCAQPAMRYGMCVVARLPCPSSCARQVSPP